MNKAINLQNFIWAILIYVFAFQRALLAVSIVFSYIDELLAIYAVFSLLIRMVSGQKIHKDELIILALLLLLIVIGVIGNVSFGIFTNTYSIIIDIISTTKVWLSYFLVIIQNWKKDALDNLIQDIACIARVLVWILFGCLLISQVVDINMSGGVRYGIKAFKFLFDNAGNCSKLFYFLVPVLTADLYYKKTTYKKMVIGVALFVWLFTLRSRAIAFIAIYILVMFFTGIKKNQTIKLKFIYVVPILLVAVLLTWDQIVFYFDSDTQARAVLFKYGLITLKDFFPIGAGFGTYGSDIAKTNYSKLYHKYGFNRIYGMSENTAYYLNDNYWPMIMGQFGLLGLIVTVTVLFLFMKRVLKDLNTNKYFYLAGLFALGWLMLSSVASKSYSEFSTICVFLFVGLLVKKMRFEEQEKSI